MIAIYLFLLLVAGYTCQLWLPNVYEYDECG